jgi:hypothetical protein
MAVLSSIDSIVILEFIYWSSVECRGLNVEGEGKKSRARVKSRG